MKHKTPLARAYDLYQGQWPSWKGFGGFVFDGEFISYESWQAYKTLMKSKAYSEIMA